MILDITSLINGKQSKIDFEYEIDTTNEENPIIPPDDVVFTSPIKVKGTITDNAGYMALKAVALAEYSTHCARCLEDVFGSFNLEFCRTVVKEGTLENEDNDSFVIAKKGLINIDTALTEDFLMEFPSKILCKESCKGLCQKCGKNLNLGSCKCAEEKEIDPRLAIFKKLLEND